MQSSLRSSMPSALIGSLLGTQYQKAALRAVPPSSGAFSRSMTSLPNQRLKSADDSPPAPPPTITMSVSSSNLSETLAAADSRGATLLTLAMKKFLPNLEMALLRSRREQ
ncbi:hypothetical protein D9M72_646470 [compost metagenome]